MSTRTDLLCYGNEMYLYYYLRKELSRLLFPTVKYPLHTHHILHRLCSCNLPTLQVVCELRCLPGCEICYVTYVASNRTSTETAQNLLSEKIHGKTKRQPQNQF